MRARNRAKKVHVVMVVSQVSRLRACICVRCSSDRWFELSSSIQSEQISTVPADDHFLHRISVFLLSGLFQLRLYSLGLTLG